MRRYIRHNCLVQRLFIVAMLATMAFAFPALMAGEKPMSSIIGTINLRHVDDNDRSQSMKVVVTLLDVSVADAGAVTMTSKDMQVPFAERIDYELPYDPKAIQSRNSYILSASIYLRTREGAYVRKYLSTQSYPVLTRGYGYRVDVDANNLD